MTAVSLIVETNASDMHTAYCIVYSTLNQFTDAGFFKRVTLHNEHCLFDAYTGYHHYFYDVTNVGLIDIPSNDAVLSRLPQASDEYDITGVNVIIHVTKNSSLPCR